MQFVRGNKAVRDHARNGQILLLFDTIKDGRRRFMGPMTNVDEYFEQIPDKTGSLRRGIIFRLSESDVSAAVADLPAPQGRVPKLRESRDAALKASRAVAGKAKTSVEYRKRSQVVSKYVQDRAMGHCEVCGFAAPFKRVDGTPYLESHHLARLADDKADAPEDVVAACPTCHRRIHHGGDGEQINKRAHQRIQRVEQAISDGRWVVVTAAVIQDRAGRVLLAQRGEAQELGNKWEFPGGKVEEGESLEDCLRRELRDTQTWIFDCVPLEPRSNKGKWH